MEEVTRTFCDICKKDITRASKYGDYDANGKETDICMERRGTFWKPLPSCREVFLTTKLHASGDKDLG